jgi:predicted PP-loop superfamily ATPase
MKPAIKQLTCQICGSRIPPGGVFYTVRTEIVSGSDGILPDTEESADRLIEKALKEISKVKTEDEFMEEVYQEIKMILCGRCRIKCRDTILDMIKY